MAPNACWIKNKELSVDTKNTLSDEYPNAMFDLTKWLKVIVITELLKDLD